MKASSRALLVCPEPLANRQPAGIGIRFVEMANVLRADGHEVTLLSPGDGLTPERIAEESARHDVAIVQGHAANDLFAHARPIPTVVDLYDPFIIENLHYFAERGAEVFTHDHATLMQSLLRGDVFLCASAAQRFFYLGALLAVGRLNPIAFDSDAHLDSLLRIAPFGVQAPRTRARGDVSDILFGGIYDWYDPVLAIDAVAMARATLPGLTLAFNRHPNLEMPQGRTAAAIEHARREGYDFVRFEPWVPYEERGAWFDRFALALLTFPQSIETDLAMRTRIYDYLWGGLPIVTSSAPGTDEIVTRYGAGVVVREDDPRAVAAAIVRAMNERDAMTSGAEAFVRDHQWSRTLAPLVDFVRAPRFDESKDAFAARHEVPAQPRSIFSRIRRRIGGRP